MHGLVASLSEGELQVDKVVARLPNSVKRNLLYIHPSCLPLCNLSIGQPCVVDGEYVQTVWPSPLTNPSMVGLSSEIQEKLQKKSKDFVLISSLKQPQLQAAVLQIKSHDKKDFYSNVEFSEFLQKETDGKYFAKSNHYTFHYFGQHCSFTVSEIQGFADKIELTTPIFASYGLTFPKGILLYGPSGCGKTFLINAVANEMNCFVTKVAAPSIWSKFYGETESHLRDIFKTAQERSPSLIIMDDVDALCPNRQNSNNELEKRVVTTLLTLMDGLCNDLFEKMILVVAATNKPDMVDPALRRPGRFDREIEIGVPTSEDRCDILKKLLQNIPNTVLPEELKRIADAAHGFVGADLLAVCKEANLQAIKTQSKSQIMVTDNHLTYGLNMVQPSAMRQVQLEVPQVRWCDIGGQEEVKQKLKQAIEWPLKHPEIFVRMGIQPPKGILLYGPPGCSKTMIAKALATESGLNFIAIKGPELFNKWVGESEKAVREVFRKARAAAPAVVFFDEIDALAVERGSSSAGSSNVEDRVLAQLLTELDGVEKLQYVTVVAATNRPDMIDKALLRPGRIDRIMYVPLPDRITREEIFHIHLKKMPIADDINIKNLAEMTESYSGAEVSAICQEAAMFAMQEDINIDQIQQRHFQKSLEVVKPRITDALLQFYANYEQKSSLHPV
ncbi:AFG2 [Acanthosepion pharaonis]|uniref:AFG2 n=1 Tax=Acanthosepion pharaonis TaxID=158019 RepID=A0A812CRW4_ACAPH|nr:AFG2 [Sepia pharaonis]